MVLVHTWRNQIPVVDSDIVYEVVIRIFSSKYQKTLYFFSLRSIEE